MGRTPTLPRRTPRVPDRAAARCTAFGVATALLLGSVFAVGPFDRHAGADALSEKRKEAERLADSIETLNSRIEQLDEDELQNRDRLRRLRERVSTTTAQVATSRTKMDAMRSLALQAALRDYANPPTEELLVFRGAGSYNEAERRAIYRTQALARDRDAQDRLMAARQDLALKEAILTRDRDTADRLAQALAKRRRETDALITKYERLEREAEGDLARLVEEARQRRAAAEARQARLALERRAEAARKALAKLASDAQKASRTTKKGAVAKTVSTLSPRASATNARARELAVEAGLSAELPASPGGRQAVQVALSQLGKPYVWGADGPGSYDCSGLMLYAWRAGGKSLPHSSRSQYASTTRVAVSQVKPGDLVFYGSPIHHVGMYIGNGQMVEASRRGKPVKISSIFRRDLVGVGRVG